MQLLSDTPVARYGYVIEFTRPDGVSCTQFLPGAMTRAGVAKLVRLIRGGGGTVTYRLARSPLPEYA